MRVAIVGSGISGLTAAYLLHRKYDVTVFESSNYVGGHTATVEVEVGDLSYRIDTGFIVFNDWTYPMFNRLLDKIGVKKKATDMGFSVSARLRGTENIEYCGSNVRGLFADRRNMSRPTFLKMIFDIVKFGRQATKDFEENNISAQLSMTDYLNQRKYGKAFREYYIWPMASAIWSTSTQAASNFSALFFVQFFYNHGLLNINHRPQWYVIDGGSNSYLTPLTQGFKEKIRVSEPVINVERNESSAIVTTEQAKERFDQVIFACHSDQALTVLEQPTQDEKAILGAIKYKENSVVLHTDERLLPIRRAAWASWNYMLDGLENKRPILTYNMNILQGVKSIEPICVTMNGDQYIDPQRVLRKFCYAHPQFDQSTVAAQEQWSKLNGFNRSWYCGAYWKNGFHEDGVTSGVRVANALGGDVL